MGRPVVPAPLRRKHSPPGRLTDRELADLLEAAARAGLSPSRFVRDAIAERVAKNAD